MYNSYITEIGARTQPGLNRLWDDLPDMPNSAPGYDKLSLKTEVHNVDRSPEAGAPTVGG